MKHDFMNLEELATLGLRAAGRDVQVSRHAIFFGPERIIIGDHSRVDAFCILSAGPGGSMWGGTSTSRSTLQFSVVSR